MQNNTNKTDQPIIKDISNMIESSITVKDILNKKNYRDFLISSKFIVV